MVLMKRCPWNCPDEMVQMKWSSWKSPHERVPMKQTCNKRVPGIWSPGNGPSEIVSYKQLQRNSPHKTVVNKRFLENYTKKMVNWLRVKNLEKTSLKIFKHYKLKPSFSIIKDNKTKDRPPTLIQSILISSSLINLIQFDQVWSNFFYFIPLRSSLIQFDQVWSNMNQFEPIWSNLNQFYLIWTK